MLSRCAHGHSLCQMLTCTWLPRALTLLLAPRRASELFIIYLHHCCSSVQAEEWSPEKISVA